MRLWFCAIVQPKLWLSGTCLLSVRKNYLQLCHHERMPSRLKSVLWKMSVRFKSVCLKMQASSVLKYVSMMPICVLNWWCLIVSSPLVKVGLYRVSLVLIAFLMSCMVCWPPASVKRSLHWWAFHCAICLVTRAAIFSGRVLARLYTK